MEVGYAGVMPALWLSEIEHRTRRPIAHLFNMLAGTSTGAMIAAGLSVPSMVSEVSQGLFVRKTEPSAYLPRYSAFEIVNLYRQKSPEIFTSVASQLPIPSSIYSWVGSKYSDRGRSAVLTKYFDQYSLRQALTELVIPAVSNKDKSKTHLFTRYEARNNAADDVRLYDVLMATTAAPTFFPPYSIPEKGDFFDGAISAGNPAQQAYDEACRYGIPSEKIFMLSMGAGTCISDPLRPELHCGKLFWAGNYPRVRLELQDGDTDKSMSIRLKNRYQRWQVWLEEPISLDDQEMGTLLERGHQYLEELYASEDNTMNKLLERLEAQALP